MKRRLSIVVGDVRVCLVCQQQPNDLDVACVRRDDKRGDTVLITLIEVGARRDQIAYTLNATPSCGFEWTRRFHDPPMTGNMATL